MLRTAPAGREASEDEGAYRAWLREIDHRFTGQVLDGRRLYFDVVEVGHAVGPRIQACIPHQDITLGSGSVRRGP